MLNSVLNAARKRLFLPAPVFLWVAFLMLFPRVLQSQNPRGSLLVTVQDSSGSRVAGASISVTQDRLAIKRSSKADAQGETRFEALQPGSYTVTVSAEGFAERTTSIVVAVSSQPVLVV